MSLDEGVGVAVTLAALAVGAAAGALGFALAVREAPSEQAADEVLRDYTDDELKVACLPFMRETATTLEYAQTRVSALEIRVRQKEVQVSRLEEEMRRTTSGSNEVSQRLDEARAQLSTLEDQLADAIEGKAQLLSALAKAKLENHEKEKELAAKAAQVIEEREDKFEEKWLRFVSGAQLNICAGASLAQSEPCQQLVQARLHQYKLRYKACVRSDQAEPEVKQARPGEQIPDEATWIDRGERVTRNWYVLFCDPALRE